MLIEVLAMYMSYHKCLYLIAQHCYYLSSALRIYFHIEPQVIYLAIFQRIWNL